MANVIRDPKVHPDAIIPDLSKPDPLVKFMKDDIAFVYGSKWKQRYFTKKGDDYFPLGAQWDITHQVYWKLEEHQLGEQTFTHFADGTAHKNRMQGNDFVQSAMYTHGVSCNSCHDVHGTDNNADLLKPANVRCLECHGPNSPSGPHAASVEAHTHHRTGTAGNECVSCHMPKIEQEIADVNISSHTFRFVPPSETASLKIPNACNVCHADKSTKWAGDALKLGRTCLLGASNNWGTPPPAY